MLKASLLRLTPIENLSVVQDGQALGQARFDLVLAHEHVLLVDLERTAPGQASGGGGGGWNGFLEVVAMHRSDAIHT